jgi:hypothetical protein
VWDDGNSTDEDNGENVSVGVEAGRWMRRVLGGGRTGDERERGRGDLERTPEPELRMGVTGSVEMV